MKRTALLAFTLFSILGLAPQISADDPLPAGLDQAIRNPKIPMIVDATIVKYNKAGHGEIKVHAIYKPTTTGKKIKVTPPKWIRGYGYVGNDKVAPLRIVAGGRSGRFIFLLDGDLLYSTYNNRFPIREGKNGALEVGIGFNGGGAPWKPLKDMVKFIPGAGAKDLGEGYSRKGEFIFFEGKRIDQEGAHDIAKFSRAVGRKLTLCSHVDAASFQVLSEEYTKDKNKVYYKWISPGRFWVVELSKTDPATFESVSFNLARDKNHAWYYGKILPGVDAASLQVVNDGFVWKDDHHVWYQHKKIAGADPVTFKHLEQAFYRDAEKVYWSDTMLEGADPKTFRTFGDDSAFGADNKTVWRGDKIVVGVDAATFAPVHQSVYKDKHGVFGQGGVQIPKADPETIRKIWDLDQHFTALLADGKGYFIFLPYRGEVFRLEDRGKLLYISRPIHHAVGKGPHKQIAVSLGELTKEGWMNQKVVPVPRIRFRNFPQEEAHLMKIYQDDFNKAWDIIRTRNKKNHETKK